MLTNCARNGSNNIVAAVNDSAHTCMSVPQRFANAGKASVAASGDTSLTGMMLIPGGNFSMGGDNEQAAADEYPKHNVTVESFYMDVIEVTNAQFKKFVTATGYITTAEKKLIGRN